MTGDRRAALPCVVMQGRHVVLIGEMGVGKTTVGRKLADELGYVFFDSDDWIEEAHGRTGAEIAAENGVPFLHDVELAALQAGLAAFDPSVIATAASVADTTRGQHMIGSANLIWLDASESVLAGRRLTGNHRRTQSEEERERTRTKRHGIWTDLASFRVDVSVSSPDDVVAQIVERLGNPGA